MSEIGLVPTYEGVGHYALPGVGILRVEGGGWGRRPGWTGAIASAGSASWRFVGVGVMDATATELVDKLLMVTGNVIGEFQYRGRALRWAGRELQFSSPFFSLREHYVLADGERMLAQVEARIRRSHRPISIKVGSAAALEPGLLLFVAFLVGWFQVPDDTGAV